MMLIVLESYTCVKKGTQMNWFGFGFNGFGQIISADVKCKVSTPVLLSDARGSDCRVSGSWSSRAAVIHTNSKKNLQSLMDVY